MFSHHHVNVGASGEQKIAKGQLYGTSWMVVFMVQGLCQINEEDK